MSATRNYGLLTKYHHFTNNPVLGVNAC